MAAAAPETPLPGGHWISASLRQLHAAGAWSGPQPAAEPTRAQAAEAVQQIVWETSEAAGPGAPGRPLKEYREHAARLERLSQELAPELAAQGVPEAELKPALARVKALWTTGHPQGVLEPFAPAPVRRDRKAREEGARQAAAEWTRGEVVLDVAGPVPDSAAAFPNALPLRAANASDNAARERLAGHNAEVWRRLREAGPPTAARLSWVPLVFRPGDAWKGAGQREARLTFEHPEAASPDGKSRIRLENWQGMTLIRIAPGPNLVVRLPTLCSCRRVVEAVWGPEGSGVLFLQSRVNYAEEKAIRRYVVDLRTGVVLNAEAVRS